MDGGEMPIFYKTASTTDDWRNVYVVGSTNNATSGNDILVQKFNKSGDLLWEQSYDGGTNSEDMGTAIFVDNQHNVYVTGGATQNATNNLDMVVLKFNSSGVLQWSYFYNFGGAPIPYDGGTAITGDNNGAIYVTGTSAGTNTLMDYVTIKLNANNGAQQWASRYDYTQLNEVPNKIRISGSSVLVTGGSQISIIPTNRWELATIRYSTTNGITLNITRTSGNSTDGMDEANDLTIDNNNNIIVVGATNNQNTGFDMSLFKFNDNLDLLWEQHFDGYSGEDKGQGVKTDANGNIYAVGYVTRPNQGRNYSIVKYSPQGVLQWSREFNGTANQNDEAVQLVVREDRIFVTGAARNGSNSEICTMGFTEDGQMFSVKTFDSPFGLNDKPTDMGVDLDGNLVIVGQVQQVGGAYRNVTFKYNVYEKPIDVVYIDSVPAYNANELIIRFDKSVMNYAAVNKRNFEAGELRDFVNNDVLELMNQKFPFDCGRLQTFKIFRKLTTVDSLSITRLGDTIPVPAFWATLSVLIPQDFDLLAAMDSVNTMQPMVHYGEVNTIIKGGSEPNDPLYSTNQASLSPLLTPFPNPNNELLVNHINMESAWDLEVGKTNVKVGVFDEAIFWKHEDFQVTQSSSNIPALSQTKIVAGKDYHDNVPVQNINVPKHPHGTNVAGIIGAVRFNNIGIAGIAGGDVFVDNSNYGVEMLSFGILDNFYLNLLGLSTDAWEAMIEGSLETTNTFGYGVHLQNHSWQLESSWNLNYYSPTLQGVVREAWKNHSIIVAARGNTSAANHSNGMQATILPATTDDRMVISVGASGTDGLRFSSFAYNGEIGAVTNWASMYGKDMDVLAPGIKDLVTTCDSPNYPSEQTNLYNTFNGTSAAAPHVTGVAALIYSKHTYPNKLASEDIERVLEKTSYQSENITNMLDSGMHAWMNAYNDKGYGLIDAYNALQKVDYPNYFIRHSQPNDIVSQQVVLVAQNQPINLPTFNQGGLFYSDQFNQGSYVADRYEATWTIQVQLPSNHEIIDFWPLFSKSCAGFKHVTDYEYSINHFEHFSFEPNLYDIYNEDVSVGFGTNSLSTITVKATYYFVKTNQSTNSIVNKWLPECGTNNPNQLIPFSFSLHIRENNELSTPENQLNHLRLFPNPADNSITLKLTNQPIKRVSIYDLQGRIVYWHELENSSNRTDIDLSSFNSGLYIVQVESIDGIVTSSKFIKK